MSTQPTWGGVLCPKCEESDPFCYSIIFPNKKKELAVECSFCGHMVSVEYTIDQVEKTGLPYNDAVELFQRT